MSEMESMGRMFTHPEIAKTLLEMWGLRNQVAHGMIEEDITKDLARDYVQKARSKAQEISS